ncbi:MAG: trimethylamine methyltransferase family protein [Desulfobacterales bacterium]|nr:MAG: trimethylamine methyltransferase family protein [Desulfobacterales bacterium]
MVDAQSGHEKTITGLLPALAGANVIYGLGMLEMGITFDLAQLVMDHEIAGMILHSLKGIPVNDETLSVDIIKEMGIGKDYLAHESTFRYMRSQSQAELIDRRMREDWEAAGSPDIYKRAHDKVIEILDTYEPPPLPDDVRATIREIVAEAEKEQGVYKEEEK